MRRISFFVITRPTLLGPLVLLLALLASPPNPALAAPLDEAQAQALVAAEDRSEADRKKDERRKPAQLLVFAQIGPGMRAADIGAGDGYTTELLMRAVGENGRVFSHNTPYVVEKFASESWSARLAKPVNKKVVRIESGYQRPLPPETDTLDVITLVYVYHDTYLSQLGDFDHVAMLTSLKDALKPGGRVIVVDHKAKGGMRGASVADDLHRIDEARVRDDFEAAGFRFDGSASFMRNRKDPRDAPFFKMTEPTDTMVHRYVKPK